VKHACLLTVLAALCLAQRTRDDYRAAYRAWRQTDPTLEPEAMAGGPSITQRADRMAAEEAKSAAARKMFLEDVAGDQTQQILWLEAAAPGTATSTKADEQFIASETAAVGRTIDTFANDADKGIQKLSQALARERTALEALSLAIGQRKKPSDTAVALTASIEQSRTKALEQSRAMLQGLKDTAEGTVRESAAWVEYYRKIGEGAQGPAVPITEVSPGVETVKLNDPIPAPPTVTPVPLTRYIGPWTFPQTNGDFHGPQPQFMDLLVHEDNGHVTGTLFSRFKLPPGSTVDPVLAFDFSGDLQTTRNQVFSLVTREGAKGTVELIPGDAFNLLIVRFKTDEKPGKLTQADVVLVKK
jgi:hypothetical protein